MKVIESSTAWTPFGETAPWTTVDQYVGVFKGTGPDGETLRKYVSFTVPNDADAEAIEQAKRRPFDRLNELGTDWRELPESK
jgi:hypothetical protein